MNTINYSSLKKIVELADTEGISFADAIINDQMKMLEVDRETLYAKMEERYKVMKESIEEGLSKKTDLKIEQNDGAKIYNAYVSGGKSLLGDTLSKVAVRAMAVSEYNASMGKICASPTAGSCGIMPASIITIEEIYKISYEKVIKSLFTSAGVGIVIANIVGVAGATAGCQAECGTATAMSAATIVDMLGGTSKMILNAVAISLKNIEGLVCDPVAGLVECPCIKRNVSGAVSAVLAADMALAGIESIVPADEVLKSMKQIGIKMSPELKETSLAGLATTETAKGIKKNI
jgi:L-serine dehydratase